MADKCENSTCSMVSEFIGETKANIEHLSGEFKDIKANARECLADIRKSAEVVKSVEMSLTAVAEITKQQNIRLQEGDMRFSSHERRMGEIEKTNKSINDAMACLPDKIQKAVQAAFDQHHEATHKPMQRRVKILTWALVFVFFFLLTTEHGMELLHLVMKINPMGGGLQ